MDNIVAGQFDDAPDIPNDGIPSKPLRVTFNLEHEIKNIDLHSDIESEDSEYDSDDFIYEYEDEKCFGKGVGLIRSNYNSPNSQHSCNNISQTQPKRYLNKINVERCEGLQLPNHVANRLEVHNKKYEGDRYRCRDKKDRATAEQVFDKRTLLILRKLIDQKKIIEINGCISTGKEANVYYAPSPQGVDYAVKVYKTSILVFKDRHEYIVGDRRFSRCNTKNNRKMVYLWAEKEMRNLQRMYDAGLPVPRPVTVKSNVLLMEFIGSSDGVHARRLKDVTLSSSSARELYRTLVKLMWSIYNKCKLVHADLSEYNLLYHEGSVFVIDVSQSVELDHPKASEFLRKDCTNINDFFRKNGVPVMSLKELFDFITTLKLKEGDVEDYLDGASKRMEAADPAQVPSLEDEVFKHQYIPQRLTEVVDYERDINLIKTGQISKEELSYGQKLTEIQIDEEKSVMIHDCVRTNHEKNMSDDEEENEEEDSGSEESNEESKFVNSARPRNESLESKKERKKLVKEEKAEKRKTKIKKHIKKRKVKATKTNAK